MRQISKMAQLLIALGILIIGFIPPFAYYIFVSRVPSISADEAWKAISESSILLFDVRKPDEFERLQIRKSVNYPFENIAVLKSIESLPEEFRNKNLLIVCDSGIGSAFAARKLLDIGCKNVRSIKGGIGAFNSLEGNAGTLKELEKIFAGIESPPFKESPVFEQWALFLTGFVVKPSYMILSLIIAAVLMRRKALDLSAVKWGLGLFFLGEFACAVNYTAFSHQSYFSEYLHSYGMVLCFGFITFAIFEGLDERIIKFSPSEGKCAAIGLCRSCYKYTSVPCGLKRLFVFIIPAFFILSFMLFCGESKMVSYNTNVLGRPYHLMHPIIYQVFEIRYCPAIALIFFISSFFALIFKKHDPVFLSKILFSAGMGAFGFGFLRFVLLNAYRDNLIWANSWEEITELIFIVGVIAVLWIFRHGLFHTEEKT